MLYPVYFNSDFTREKGRKVSLENSVVDPNVDTIIKIMQQMQLELIFE